MEEEQKKSTIADKKKLSLGQKVFLSIPIKLFGVVSKSFFRSLKIVGQENIPKNEPTIICANHQNQFMDGINIYGAISTPERPVRFLFAGKSYRRPVIGHCGKWTNVIPVERPQDFAKKGEGSIISVVKDRVRGSGTKFKTQAQEGGSIVIKDVQALVILEIISDEEIKIKPTELDIQKKEGECSFKIQPKINQSEMYDTVSDALYNNDLIGIFPEGGSSDRTDLLPLKAGVCIMALEAMVKYNIPVNVICCGINYFKAHKFRSKVLMEFGAPYKIPLSYIAEYKTNKRETIAKLLNQIDINMRMVLYIAPSYQELTSILLARRIYQPDDRRVTPFEDQELNKRFSKGYSMHKDKPEIQIMISALQAYKKQLKFIGISDRELKKFHKDFFKDLFYSFKSLIVFILCFSFALPGAFLNYPVGYVLSHLSVAERQKCLKESSVKVRGNDIVASFQVKLAILFLPIYHTFFSSMMFLCFRFFSDLSFKKALLYSVLFFIFYPFYSYMMLKAGDKFVRCFKNVKARFTLVFSYSKIKQLRETRRALKQQIRDFVNEHFVEIIGENNDRIIEKDSSEDRKCQKKKNIGKNILGILDDSKLDHQQFVDDTFAYLKELGI